MKFVIRAPAPPALSGFIIAFCISQGGLLQEGHESRAGGANIGILVSSAADLVETLRPHREGHHGAAPSRGQLAPIEVSA